MLHMASQKILLSINGSMDLNYIQAKAVITTLGKRGSFQNDHPITQSYTKISNHLLFRIEFVATNGMEGCDKLMYSKADQLSASNSSRFLLQD